MGWCALAGLSPTTRPTPSGDVLTARRRVVDGAHPDDTGRPAPAQPGIKAGGGRSACRGRGRRPSRPGRSRRGCTGVEHVRPVPGGRPPPRDPLLLGDVPAGPQGRRAAVDDRRRGPAAVHGLALHGAARRGGQRRQGRGAERGRQGQQDDRAARRDRHGAAQGGGTGRDGSHPRTRPRRRASRPRRAPARAARAGTRTRPVVGMVADLGLPDSGALVLAAVRGVPASRSWRHDRCRGRRGLDAPDPVRVGSTQGRSTRSGPSSPRTSPAGRARTRSGARDEAPSCREEHQRPRRRAEQRTPVQETAPRTGWRAPATVAVVVPAVVLLALPRRVCRAGCDDELPRRARRARDGRPAVGPPHRDVLMGLCQPAAGSPGCRSPRPASTTRTGRPTGHVQLHGRHRAGAQSPCARGRPRRGARRGRGEVGGPRGQPEIARR